MRRQGKLEVSVYRREEMEDRFSTYIYKRYFYRKFVMEAEVEVKGGLVRLCWREIGMTNQNVLSRNPL